MLKIQFTLGDRSFEKEGYPKIGQLIDLETTKNALAKGFLGDLYSSGLKVAVSTARLIEAVAFFEVFFPELVKSLKSENLLEIELADAAELVDAYSKHCSPYMEKVYKMLNGVVTENE
jgi:hypothetical protein